MPGKFKQPNPESGFLSPQQVQELFGVSKSFLDHLPDSAGVRVYLGRKPLYVRERFVAYLLQQTRSQPPAKMERSKGQRGRPPKPPIQERRPR
jgi:hypothetical protein